MKQTIEINVPDGKRIVYNEETQTIKFIDIDEPIRSKTWDEFCKNHPDTKGEWYINNYSAIDMLGYHTSGRKDIHRNNLETKEDAEGILALIQLTRLHDEWVGDWKPDWERSNYYSHRYAISYRYGVMKIESTEERRLLTFPTKRMAEEFSFYFIGLIEKSKKFI